MGLLFSEPVDLLLDAMNGGRSFGQLQRFPRAVCLFDLEQRNANMRPTDESGCAVKTPMSRRREG